MYVLQDAKPLLLDSGSGLQCAPPPDKPALHRDMQGFIPTFPHLWRSTPTSAHMHSSAPTLLTSRLQTPTPHTSAPVWIARVLLLVCKQLQVLTCGGDVEKVALVERLKWQRAIVLHLRVMRHRRAVGDRFYNGSKLQCCICRDTHERTQWHARLIIIRYPTRIYCTHHCE